MLDAWPPVASLALNDMRFRIVEIGVRAGGGALRAGLGARRFRRHIGGKPAAHALDLLDAEIAKALHIPKPQVLNHIAELSALGEVICCRVTRFVGGKKIEGVSCRLSAYVPPKATGPKPGAKRAASANANLNNTEAHIV